MKKDNNPFAFVGQLLKGETGENVLKRMEQLKALITTNNIPEDKVTAIAVTMMSAFFAVEHDMPVTTFMRFTLSAWESIEKTKEELVSSTAKQFISELLNGVAKKMVVEDSEDKMNEVYDYHDEGIHVVLTPHQRHYLRERDMIYLCKGCNCWHAHDRDAETVLTALRLGGFTDVKFGEGETRH